MLAVQLSRRAVSGFWGTSGRALSYHFSCRDIRKSARCCIGSSYPSQLSSQYCSLPDTSKDSAQGQSFPEAPNTNSGRALEEQNQLRDELARKSKEIDKLRGTIHSVLQLLSAAVDYPLPDTTNSSPKNSKPKGPPEDQQPGEEGNRLKNPKKRPWEEAFKPLPGEQVDAQHPLKPHWEGENNQLAAQEVNCQPQQTQNLGDEEEGKPLTEEHRDKRHKPNPKGDDNKGWKYGSIR